MMYVRVLFWLPTIALDTVRVLIEPRAMFRYTYRPSSEDARQAELVMRNKARLASYYAKRSMMNNTNEQ